MIRLVSLGRSGIENVLILPDRVMLVFLKEPFSVTNSVSLGKSNDKIFQRVPSITKFETSRNELTPAVNLVNLGKSNRHSQIILPEMVKLVVCKKELSPVDRVVSLGRSTHKRKQ